MTNSTKVIFDVPRGATNYYKQIYKGLGHDTIEEGSSGDLVVHLKTQKHNTYVREGADLHLSMNITLQEALFGFHRTIHLINGSDTMV